MCAGNFIVKSFFSNPLVPVSFWWKSWARVRLWSAFLWLWTPLLQSPSCHHIWSSILWGSINILWSSIKFIWGPLKLIWGSIIWACAFIQTNFKSMIAKQSTCHWVFEIFIIKSCCFYKGLFCDAIISISTWFSFALYACTLFAYWHIDFLSEPDPTCLKFSCHLIVCTWILALLYLSCFHIITTKKETGLQSIYLFIPVIKPIFILCQSCIDYVFIPD